MWKLLLITVLYVIHCRFVCSFISGTVVRDNMGITLDKVGKEVLGTATKVVITKDSTYIVSDGSTREAVQKRVSQIQNLVEVQIINPCPLLFAIISDTTHHMHEEGRV